MVRRRRFEQAHPEAVILPPAAGRWRAVVPPGLIPGDGTRTTLGAWDLADLMDQLDAIYPAPARTQTRSASISGGRQSAASKSASRSARARGSAGMAGSRAWVAAGWRRSWRAGQGGKAWPRSP